MFSSIVIGFEEGLKYLPFIIAACILFRIAHFPDIGIEGTFALGATAMAFSTYMTWPYYVGIICAFLFGAIGGLLTGGLFVWCKLNNLLCGLITVFISYGFCYTLLGFNSTVSLDIFFSESVVGSIGIALGIIICIFFSTRYGLVFRIAGESPSLLNKLGFNPKNKYLLLLVAGNAVAGVAGALVASANGVASLRIADGKLFLAIMSLVIGEGILSMLITVFKYNYIKKPNRWEKIILYLRKSTIVFSGGGVSYLILSAVIGSLGYWIIFNVCIELFGANEFIQNTEGGVEFTQSVLGGLTAFFLIISTRISRRSHALPLWTFLGKLQ
jgi:putative ABC transport system permease protein